MGQHCVDCVRAERGWVPRARITGAARPTATYALIAINCLVFLICAAQAGSASAFGGSKVFVDGVLYGPAVADGEVWRLLTSGFLHFSLLHIAVNMFSLYVLGRDVELTMGTPRFLAVYGTALLGGSALVMLMSPNDIAAGASGAIYGLMGAALIVVLRARLSPAPVLTLIAVNIAITFAIPNISLWAHLGGLVFGAATAAAFLLLPGRLGGRVRSHTVGWAATVVLVVVAIALGVTA